MAFPFACSIAVLWSEALFGEGAVAENFCPGIIWQNRGQRARYCYISYIFRSCTNQKLCSAVSQQDFTVFFYRPGGTMLQCYNVTLEPWKKFCSLIGEWHLDCMWMQQHLQWLQNVIKMFKILRYKLVQMFKILRCKLGARKGARFLQGASNSVRLDIFGWKTKNRHFVLTMNPHCRLSYYICTNVHSSLGK